MTKERVQQLIKNLSFSRKWSQFPERFCIKFPIPYSQSFKSNVIASRP